MLWCIVLLLFCSYTYGTCNVISHLHALYYYVSTFWSMCTVPNMAVLLLLLLFVITFMQGNYKHSCYTWNKPCWYGVWCCGSSVDSLTAHEMLLLMFNVLNLHISIFNSIFQSIYYYYYYYYLFRNNIALNVYILSNLFSTPKFAQFVGFDHQIEEK